jgi:hypothetical protein
MKANALSADLDGAYPPAMACHHAVTDDVAAVVIVVGIVIEIRVRPDTESHEPTTVKSAVEAVGTAAETAMNAGTAEAASGAATHDSVAAHAASAATDAGMTAHAAAAATTVTAASECRRRLNQADRGQCDQSHHQFARHVSLHPMKSPVKHGTPSHPDYSTTKKPAR